MKAKMVIVYFIVLIIPFCDVFNSGYILSISHKPSNEPKTLNQTAENAQPVKTPDLGSIDYIIRIEILEKIYGPIAAMDRIISDVTRYGYLLDDADHEKVIRLYSYISGLVSNIGTVDKEIHYFRNKLNRVPENLPTLISLNKSLTPDKQWRLLPVKGSLYHMQGKGGEYNLKFVSPEGFCEAVYNKRGVLLKEFNDPVNMGTFNYAAGINDKEAHGKYDVAPYIQWGNSVRSPQKGPTDIKEGAKAAYEQYMKNCTSVDAYRNRVLSMYYNGGQETEPTSSPAFNLEELLHYSS